MAETPAVRPRSRDLFNTLWTAKAVSNLSDGIALAAIPLLAVSLTRDPVGVSAVTTAGRLPWLLFPLVAGAVVDRVDRKSLIVRTDAVRALFFALLTVGVHAGWMTIPLLAAAVCCLGLLEVLSDMSGQSLVPGLVGRDRLEAANSRLQATELLANQLVGTPVGAFLFAWLAAFPFGLDAAGFLASSLLIATLPGSYRPERGDRSTDGIGAEIREGLRWLWGHRVLRVLAVAAGTVNFAGALVLSLLALYLQDVLHLPPQAYGIILGVAAVGGLGGSLVAAAISRRLGPGVTAIACEAVCAIAAVTAVLSAGIVLFSLMLMVIMATVGIWNVVTVSYRQRVVPDALLGRINSVYRLVAWGSMPLGSLTGGVAAELFGLRAPFWLAAGIIGLTVPLLLTVVNNRTMTVAEPA